VEESLSFDTLAFPSVILLGFSALILLISYDWRLSVSALGVMYVGVFFLVALTWPIEMAIIKLVTGWISASVLGISSLNRYIGQQPKNTYLASEVVFRISAAGLVSLVTISLADGVHTWLLILSKEQVLGGVILIGMGLLHMGFSTQPLRTVVGLLTFFAGFEIIYISIESSILVTGLLAVTNMGMALVGSYLMISPNLEVDE
jgi:hypothetical protein